MAEIGIGSTLWVVSRGTGIYASAAALVITSETRVSWVCGESSWDQQKFNKKGLLRGDYDLIHLTAESASNAVFAKRNAWQIGQMVQRLEDGALLRQIAALVGFQEQ